MNKIADPGRELRHIVHINEQIKQVVAVAFKINLMAMNAIFLAKRAGPAALGFGVLSNELRRFASDLQQQMNVLRDATSGSVASVTTLVKQTRLNRILERARRESQDGGRQLLEDLQRARAAGLLAEGETRLATLNRRLTQMIADTVQLVELGSVLARSAKIEAAYGGGFAPSLMQVSNDFEEIIGMIQRSLVDITRNQTQEVHA